VPTERITDSSLESLFQAFRDTGFPLVGAVDLELAQADFALHAKRYEEWISAGFHGEMQYLVRGEDRRKNPALVLPGAKSVIAVAIPYRRQPAHAEDAAPRYARYLEGPDYHTHLPNLLETPLREWAEREGVKWKICVDTSAVLERSWAALCGLGWIGKNTLLINPKLGSYLFIGVIFLDRETGRAPAPLPNFCGNCQACITSCPTEAFVSPGKLDSRKCISYLILERRGEWPNEAKSQSDKMGNWVAGCDICQEVCPFNLKPSKLPETWPSDVRDSALISDWTTLDGESEQEYQARVKTSALSRIKFPDMRRNISRVRKP